MGSTKKISADQFLLDFINKQYEVCGSEKHFDSLDDLIKYSKEYNASHKDTDKSRWFEEYSLTKEQYQQVKDYFYTHFYDWKPKSYSKTAMQSQFNWTFLEYGFTEKEESDEK